MDTVDARQKIIIALESAELPEVESIILIAKLIKSRRSSCGESVQPVPRVPKVRRT